MRYAIIENGAVANIAESESALNSNWIQTDDSVQIGDLYKDGIFSSSQPTDEEIIKKESQKIRQIRNYKLEITDWTQLADTPVNKQAWADYRQALRDIPQQAGFPTEINWPQEPQ